MIPRGIFIVLSLIFLSMAVVLIVNNTDIAKVNKSIDEQAALVDSLQREIEVKDMQILYYNAVIEKIKEKDSLMIEKILDDTE
jgi:hypothetical protein